MNSHTPSRIIRTVLGAGLSMVGLLRLGAAETVPLKSEILTAYVKVADAFAADDLGGAKAAASALAEKADAANQFAIEKQSLAIAKSGSLADARNAFKPLSYSMEPLADGEKGYRVMTCPMANAEWVQAGREVKNPYLGGADLSCGRPKTPEPKHVGTPPACQM